MKFKQEKMKAQFEARPAKLQEVCEYFAQLSEGYGVEPVVTRVMDPVAGESGVHMAGRAVDFRNELRFENGSRFLYTEEQAEEIVKAINERYPRYDGKVVCLHHSHRGAPLHFHIQIPLDWATKEGLQ